MRKNKTTTVGFTLVEVMVGMGLISLLLGAVLQGQSYVVKQSQLIYRKNLRTHIITTYVDMMRNNLALFQSSNNLCGSLNTCGTDAGSFTSNLGLNKTPCALSASLPTTFWNDSGICNAASLTAPAGCLGTMQAEIQPLGNGAQQRGFYVITLWVCHPDIATGSLQQYTYMVNAI